MNHERAIAYFSMEIAFDEGMPTYAGGLGVLAGDTVRAAADLQVPLVAVTLLHRKGYFRQEIDDAGWQHEFPLEWRIEDFAKDTGVRAEITLQGRAVQIRAWEMAVAGVTGFNVPAYLLDTDLPQNHPDDRRLTDVLYGGDVCYRLCQEAVLGMGGIRILHALGHSSIRQYHMNEGHSALLTLQLLDERLEHFERAVPTPEDIEAVHDQCVFTTHTPVTSGHDQFPLELVDRVLGHRAVFDMQDVFCCGNVLNMTYLAMNLSHYINGVAKRHGEVSQHMFGRYHINYITNGVDVNRWAAEPFRELFDKHMPGWQSDHFSLRYALGIPSEEIQQAHRLAKATLLGTVRELTGMAFDAGKFTLGFARRATAYKRPDLLFEDVERRRSIARLAPGNCLQVVFAGKAHPRDDEGKRLIQRVVQFSHSLQPEVAIVYLSDYDIALAQAITAGVDLWLNTPEPPLEASGTSGMKAAINGVPSLSILDGWWIEGCIEGVTGWAIGQDARHSPGSVSRQQDADSLYEKLEHVIVPLFRDQPAAYLDVMRHAIALNGSFFNTQRMIQQYAAKAYF